MLIRDIHMAVLENQLDVLSANRQGIKNRTITLVCTPIEQMNDVMKDDLARIIDMANIIYNQTSLESLIDDDEYDILVEKYKVIYGETPIGQMSKISDEVSPNQFDSNLPNKRLFKYLDDSETMYRDIIIPNDEILFRKNKIKVDMDYQNNSENQLSTHDQLYPELVGTLNKCKYVLDKDAPDNKNEKVFERDYIAKHIQSGLYDSNRVLNFMLQLKYDGVSVVATVKGNKIIEARSRGDIESNKAVDLTPILYGYTFDNVNPNDDMVLGIKFEAIMTYYDLAQYNQETGSDYKNCRTAITSIFAKLNGRRYQKYITLVPLDAELPDGVELSFIQKLSFLNTYFANTIKSEAAICRSDYVGLLYQTFKFLEDAKNLRDYSYFMYDGIVFTYLDEDIVDKLGRIGSINQYQMAIKFPTSEKITRFRGYTYTIGKDGRVTPMINYDPVIFLGTYHTKSSGHSYGRFKELDLAVGDLIKVDYVNDVMPYVTKIDCQENRDNPHMKEPFITHCPYCNQELTIGDSGKTVYCMNPDCPSKRLKRLVGFFDSLNIKDFSEAYLSKLEDLSLREIYELPKIELIRRFGSEIMADKFKIRLTNGLNNRFDYELLGALGFTNIGNSKWKSILSKIKPVELFNLLTYDINSAQTIISNINGIGPLTASTIINEFPSRKLDMEFVLSLPHKEISNSGNIKSVRFTGVRDSSLCNTLNNIGFDASGSAGVTKTTDILVVPYEGYSSSKVEKAKQNGVLIVPINEIRDNPSKFL